ncbi:MBOAT family O-acyltransferase [Hyphococcus sp.]|uniref:MBOAT family O-acyltransferase n=1 Tax=Hyphococcus sp. TaxID=2038636 RepID=UPI003D112EF3
MVFSSFEFIFLFLPVAYGVLLALTHYRASRWAIIWLIGASLFFYGYWAPIYLILIVLSILANFAAGYFLDPERETPKQQRRAYLIAAVAANLLLLGYFKYLVFFADTLRALKVADFDIGPIILPIGISFFTFQQISYQVDRYLGKVGNKSFLNYALFVVYFPQLIAGPIVHHKEMLDQFQEGRGFRLSFDNLSYGTTYFVLGLAKKTLLADPLAVHANAIFAAAERGVALTTADAWTGALAYTGQLYFDFAGYSSMAIGLAAMIGVKLPLNFNSPYKSLSIQEFWRRWHITLSRFLRDYLYIPLGGNRHGEVRRLLNLMLTMLIGGLWHGAAWTFVVWGGLHGAYLVVNRAFDVVAEKFAPGLLSTIPAKAAAWLLTMLSVVVAWVFFRATSFESAFAVLRAMFAAGPEGAASRLTLTAGDWALFLVAGFFAFIAPNAAQIMRYDAPNIKTDSIKRWMTWRPTAMAAVAVGILGFFAILATQKNNEFIYFQF